MRPTKEQELELFRKYKNEGCIKSRDILIDAHMGMMVKQSRKLTWNESLQEELVQEGVIGVLRYLDKFDPSLGNRLITYLTTITSGSMKTYMRQTADIFCRAKQKEVKTDDDYQLIDSGFMDNIIQERQLDRIADYLNSISPFKAECFISSNVSDACDHNNAVLAEKYGCTRSNISFVSQQTKKKMQKLLCKYY
tara:strand:+ start:23509 stop:24090 length:582 start_codon:yes stop_codon:yes gene_type:complete